jgi:hypothetical protein
MNRNFLVIFVALLALSWASSFEAKICFKRLTTAAPPSEEPSSEEPPTEVCLLNPATHCPTLVEFEPTCCPWQHIDEYEIIKIYRRMGVILFRNSTIMYCCHEE